MDIEALIAEMTLEEKVGLCSGADAWNTRTIERLQVQALRMTDGPHGTRVTYADRTGSKPATCYPTGSAMAATWNPDLVEKVGAALGDEARAQGCDILLGPAVNIHRTPLCGRNFEYYSEDPYLAGRMAVAYIHGLQSQNVGASIKHFAANNQEFDRMTISAEVKERALREIYLPAFEAAVKEAQPWTVMCSYNKINGVYSSANHWLLSDILKDEWGFAGFVVSDWGAVHDRAAAANASLDLEMPGRGEEAVTELVDNVKSGIVSEVVIDEKVRRILKILEKAIAGGRSAALPDGSSNTPEHQRLAREAADEAIVLLKNRDHLLPLAPGKIRSLAVIGPMAAEASIQGGGSAHINPYYAISPLEGLRKRCGSDLEIGYEQGCKVVTAEGNEIDPDTAGINAARDLAARMDVAIVFAGLTWQMESEGFDRKEIDLPPQQVALIKSVARANPNTVVVLSNGSALEMKSWIDGTGAVIEAWFSGQEVGNALAGVIFGDTNPSGKLTETFPARYADTPAYTNYPGENGEVVYGEGIFVGYRYYEKKGIEPLFPFGFGLSYTTFEYTDLVTVSADPGSGVIVNVSVRVRNNGKVAGKEVVQLYIHDPVSSLVRPVKELKGFAKVQLEPGQSKIVEFSLKQRDFAYYDPGRKSWAAEAGTYEILVGSSSRDIRLTGIFDLKEDLIYP